MNLAFDDVIGASEEARAGLFATTGQRLGTTAQNVEKDFWVCWTLDALFNGREGGPRLLFKGGTSLSKGFGLIRRFSEDVDVTVFRDDFGQGYSFDELAEMSRKKRDRALNESRPHARPTSTASFTSGYGQFSPSLQQGRTFPPISSVSQPIPTTANRS